MSNALLKEKVLQRLRKDIVANVLKPGQFLSERELSEELKISKTPIREAIQMLYKEGFVEFLPQKGCFVSHVTFNDIRDIFQIREAIEGIACRDAAKRCDLGKLDAFEREFKSLTPDTGDGIESDYEASRVLGTRFHRFLIESTGNQRLIEIATNANFHLRRVAAIYAFQYPPGVLDQIYAEHLDILEAVKAGNGKQAEALMRAHIRNFMATLKMII